MTSALVSRWMIRSSPPPRYAVPSVVRAVLALAAAAAAAAAAADDVDVVRGEVVVAAAK